MKKEEAITPDGTRTQEEIFRLALVGAGRMGRTHLRALAGSRNIEVVAVAEPLDSLRKHLTDEGKSTYFDLAHLLSHIRPDGVLIAAPTTNHLSIVRTAAAAGVPILCEKPAGLTSTDVHEAAQLASQYGIPFQVAYWRRYVPAVQTLRQRILDGALGDIHLVISSQWDGEPPSAQFRIASGGIFVDMGVHEFDQIRWLTGQEITDVHAAAASYLSDPAAKGDVDSAQALLTLSGGSTGLVSLGRHYPDGDMATVEVFGTRGHERIAVLDPADGETPMLQALRHQAEAFAAYVRSGTTDGAGVEDAVAALRSAEQASKTTRAGTMERTGKLALSDLTASAR